MPSFKSVLSGSGAFYNVDYEATTRRDFASVEALPPTYAWKSESKIWRLARQVFSILCFPILGYKSLHNFIGKIIVPATTPKHLYRSEAEIHWIRQNSLTDTEWKYKRLSIEVDGVKIDTVIIGKERTLNNGIWTVVSNGNGQFYEDSLLPNSELKAFLPKIYSNAILFNYPGVMASEGTPNRQGMAKAYRAILCFLEREVGARKIIGYSHSLGGGVQSDALASHTLRPDIGYVFVKSRTFSSLSKEVSCIFSERIGWWCGALMGIALQALGWDMQPHKTSKKLAAKEIILQTCNVTRCPPLSPSFTNSRDIVDDDVISADASHAKALLEDHDCPKDNKVFLAIPEHHNEPLRDETLSALAAEINQTPLGE